MNRDDGEILRAVVYRFHATIAETFRRGAVFLAGDAALQMPPFQGQGMCTGLRDVDKLIWKLAMVKRGHVGEPLLDTYAAERRPPAIALVERSMNTGKLIDAYADIARGGPAPSELEACTYSAAAAGRHRQPLAFRVNAPHAELCSRSQPATTPEMPVRAKYPPLYSSGSPHAAASAQDTRRLGRIRG